MEQLIIGVFEQGFIYAIHGAWRIYHIQNIRLSGSVRRQYFPIRSSSDNRHALLRKEPTACINCSNSSRSNCRNGHRNHTCKIQSQRLIIRNYRYDRSLYLKLKNCRRKRKMFHYLTTNPYLIMTSSTESSQKH